MSDTQSRPRIPDRAPPEPGSEPMLDRGGTRLRPFREHFAIYTRGRASGHHVPTPNNLAHEVFAAASDQAAQHAQEAQRDGDKVDRIPFTPAFVAYARAAVMELMVRGCPVSPFRRAEANHRAREAQAKHNAAVDALQTGRQRRREARSQRHRTPQPRLGSALTGWWMPIVVVSVMGLLETFLSKPALKTSLELSDLEAWGAAMLFGAVIMIGCERLGSMIGAQAPTSKKGLSRLTAVCAVTFLCLAGALTVTMATSREVNGLAEERVRLLSGGDGSELGFQMPEQSPELKRSETKPSESGGFALADANPVSSGDEGLRMDLSYTIPLALLAMVVAILVGMGREVARASIQADEDLRDADEDLRSDEEAEHQTRLAEQHNQDQFERVALTVGAHTDELRDFYVRVTERFLHLYSLECTRRKIAARPVVVPPPPDPVAAAMRIIDPTEPSPREGAPTSWEGQPVVRSHPAPGGDGVRSRVPPPPSDDGAPGESARPGTPDRDAEPAPQQPASRPPVSNPAPRSPTGRPNVRRRSDGTPPWMT